MTDPSDGRPATAATGPPNGVLLVDKPSGVTSHDVVGRVRAVLRTRKVGHAGTLDPMATGVLVLGIGPSTRLIGQLALTDKAYAATIRLGIATDTDDAEGTVTDRRGAADLVDGAWAEPIAALTGDILQVPSTVSAIKVDGVRAYQRARAGEQVELAARPVTVSRFAVLAPPRRCTVGGCSDSDAAGGTAVVDLDVEVECSSGTYIRALARDLGVALGTGAHLTALRRTRVGLFDVAGAVDVFGPEGPAPRPEPGGKPVRRPIPEALRAEVAGAVIPAGQAAALAFTVRIGTDAEVRALSYGQSIAATGTAGPVAILDAAGDLVALVRDDGDRAAPVVVFRAAG
ncbi:tRNA pseudouridine(55) synthase TruB [Nakamurella aerolata]|uniref:tRNA pseudouridine synthase B n=1 Tax=Nakamurella aerolata TaxID=1656892 RepID=A0A849ABF7_9ACTN|nr:tRNA pseudouridine(55) synthase TruB [Nakamurella aerolata]NNG34242.1 tRNA pseudouridine(55) synthase TruB [Nakamurella aerolata]